MGCNPMFCSGPDFRYIVGKLGDVHDCLGKLLWWFVWFGGRLMVTRALPGSTTGSSSDRRSSADGRGIQGAFFDLGGTLFTYHAMPSRTGELLIDAAAKLGISVAPDALARAYQQANRKVAVAYGQKNYYLHADLFRDVFIEFCTAVGGEFDMDVWEDYRHKHDANVIAGLQIRPDCRSTMEALRERGLYLSIASNIDHFMLEALVEREGLDELFDDWTSSEEAQSCKPHGDFFDCTQSKSGLDVGDILFVGDSPEHDILGGYSAGMRTALIVEPGVVAPLQSGKETVDPDHTIGELSDLLNILV